MSLEESKVLYAYFFQVQDYPDLCGRTALMWACAKKYPLTSLQIEILDVMCRNGADMRHTDQDGSTALHIAVAENHDETVRALITLGERSRH